MNSSLHAKLLPVFNRMADEMLAVFKEHLLDQLPVAQPKKEKAPATTSHLTLQKNTKQHPVIYINRGIFSNAGKYTAVIVEANGQTKKLVRTRLRELKRLLLSTGYTPILSGKFEDVSYVSAPSKNSFKGKLRVGKPLSK